MRSLIRLLTFAVLLSTFARADERILFYRSDITVQPDASLLVKEVIRVRAENSEIRHGIYRDFPTEYLDRFGNRYNVRFSVVSAERDGATEEWHQEAQSNGVRVYLGDKNTTVSFGPHTYALTYSVTRELGFFADHDELYWNVTGNGWVFPMDSVEAWVHLPAAVPRNAVKYDGYTGPQGSAEKDFRYSTVRGDPFFTATRHFGAHEGMTIVVSFPKGYVAAPTQTQKRLDWVSDNAPAVAGAVGFLIVLLYYVVVWIKVGRDPKAGTIMPLYELPAGFSPAAVRYLKNMGYDNKVFAAAVIDIAVKKNLTIRQESDGSYTLVPIPNADDKQLTAEEKSLRFTLVGSGSELRLKQANYTMVSSAIKNVQSSLKSGMEKIYFFSHGSYMIPGLVLTVLSAAVVLELAPPDPKKPIGFLSLWLSFWTLGCVMLVKNAIEAWRTRSNPAGGNGNPTLFAIIFLIPEFFVIWLLAQSISMAGVLLLVAMVATNLIFHHLLKAPTLAGRKLLDQIEGFRMFLSATEEDVLNRMNPPNRTPQLFEKYLPYAVALDCEKAWGTQFAGILAAAAVGGAQYTPSWYSGSNFSAGNFSNFASSMSNGLSSAIASSSTAPGSSSGMGAGSSGGGGGGGW